MTGRRGEAKTPNQTLDQAGDGIQRCRLVDGQPLISFRVRALRMFVMLSPGILYTTAALMALVATACTALCLVWSVPAWRHWLAPAGADVRRPKAGELSGWPAQIGSVLVSAGIAACALLAWYGVYSILAAI